MHNHNQISLNAIRVFATAANKGSITAAATTLGVTPSAVSHQIKNLEIALSTTLFDRGHNSIDLSDAGEAFLENVQPGLKTLEQATNSLTRDANELTVRVSSTLAVRWLIPSLDRFKSRYPDIRVRIETSREQQVQLDHAVDLAITYIPADASVATGTKILPDLCRPVLAPRLFDQTENLGHQSAFHIPAITCTDDNWDWKRWASHFGLRFDEMRFSDHFDIDDAAIHAATAGLGMVLAPAFMTQVEINAGTLIELPGFVPIELGAYYLLSSQRTDGVVKAFSQWLQSELENLT